MVNIEVLHQHRYCDVRHEDEPCIIFSLLIETCFVEDSYREFEIESHSRALYVWEEEFSLNGNTRKLVTKFHT